MQLVPNWADVMKRAWSVRFMLLAVVLDAIAGALPNLNETMGLPDWTFAALSAGVTSLALVARHVAQKDLPGGEEE